MLDGAPLLPAVMSVSVRGSSWATPVPSYSIPVGSASQFNTLPWTNLDEIQLTFNKDVIVQQSDLSLLGVNTPVSSPAGFSYDPTTFTATWTLPQPLAADKSEIVLSDNVHDAPGNHLDGEWSDGSQVFPSGNGVVAANFTFQFDVLPCDVDQNGAVNIFDMVKLWNRLLAAYGDPNYSILYDLNGDGVITGIDGGLLRADILARLPAAPPPQNGPTITMALAHDTGISNTDNITMDPTISGTISDSSGISKLLSAIDSTSPTSFVDVTSALQPGGQFNFSRASLEQILGGPLPDGSHTLHLIAVDSLGNAARQDTSFILDTTPPPVPTFSLAPNFASVTGTTTFRAVTLLSNGEAGDTVSAGTNGASAVIAGDGSFQLPNVVLTVGANSIAVTATDVAGNTSTSPAQTINRVVPTTANQVAIDWDNAVLNAIVQDASTPPVASRSLAMVSAAMYDAVNSVNGASAYLFVHVSAPAGSSDIAAVAQAAHDVLTYLYPAQQATFDAQLAMSLAGDTDPAAKANGVGVGAQVAAAIIAQRANDGATNFTDYTPGTCPGQWQPTYPMYAPALLPNWARLKPFLMTSDSQFRPAGPPDLSSSQWVSDYNLTMSLGSATSTTRTSDQTQIARFWNDGVGTVTPAGQWNQITLQLLQAKGNVSLFDTLKLLAQLNTAMGDAAIVAWDAKYTDNFWRPITAIQAGGDNPALTADPNWVPLLNTPNFPEYVSGHSTFSSAAATILDNYFGQNVPFTTGSPSPGMSGVTRSYTGFDAAAQEAGISRIYGGIHYLTSDLDGIAAGKALGQYVLQKFADTADTTPPVVSYSSPQNQASMTNPAIAGLVSDNLSGVKSLVGQFDSGPTFNVSFDASGHFTVSSSFALDGSADGAHVLHLTATDYAGNISSSYDYNFTLDTAPPILTITSPALTAGQTGPISLAAGAALTGTADGTGSAIVMLHYQFDNGMTIPVSFGADGSFSQALDLSRLAVGAHTLVVTATDAAGNTTATTLNVNLPTVAPLTVTNFTPTAGSSEVGATYRPEIFLSRPINTATLNPSDFFATDSTGTKLPATIVPANDGNYAWLFLTNPLPGANSITVTVDGTQITAPDGAMLDAAGTGSATGSKLTYSFTTVNTAALPSTTLSGVLADPGPDLKPGTPDDVAAGPDGVLMTADDVYKLPIAGVTVSIAGTNLSTTTDSQGRFSFASVPSGDVKLMLEGPIATNPPAGFYFPEMVMDLNILPGQANTVMAAMARTGTGNSQPGAAITNALGVYLPRLHTSLLQTVSNSTGGQITVSPANAPDLTTQQRQSLTLNVAPNSIIGMDGQPMSSAQIGISAVDPSLVMEMLPPGVMQHSFDITIQAIGVATFSIPVPVTFPNVFNAAPGTKLNFLSFNHTTGRLEIDGTCTVSSDGQSVTTDPGTGVTHPGWHSMTPPGSPSDPPCPPMKHDVDVPPDMRTSGIKDYFFTKDSGVMDLSFARGARASFTGEC